MWFTTAFVLRQTVDQVSREVEAADAGSVARLVCGALPFASPWYIERAIVKAMCVLCVCACLCICGGDDVVRRV